MNDEVTSNCGRRSAASEMRSRAEMLENQARQWRHLANRLDEMEEYAKSQQKEGEDGPVPYFGVGSQAEGFLWELACGYVK